MKNQDAYQALTDAGVHWDRKDDKHIVVWTTGYKTEDAYMIERFLQKVKMVCMSMEYDKHSGKTCAIYKHGSES